MSVIVDLVMQRVVECKADKGMQSSPADSTCRNGVGLTIMEYQTEKRGVTSLEGPYHPKHGTGVGQPLDQHHHCWQTTLSLLVRGLTMLCIRRWKEAHSCNHIRKKPYCTTYWALHCWHHYT